MCVCVSSLVVFWQERGHKVLHELKINFSRTLSNLEKFWFSRKVRTWGAPLSKIWVGVGTTVMGKLHSQAPQGFVLQGQIFHCHDKSSTVCSQRSFSTHSAQVASSPCSHPHHPLGTAWKALGAVGLNCTNDNLRHSSEQFMERERQPHMTLPSVEPPQSLCQFQWIF